MADDQHVRWLLEGVRNWNERRERDPFTPDLSGVFFSEVFSDSNRRDANGRVLLAGVNLEIWPETPILPKPLFSWRRLPMQ